MKPIIIQDHNNTIVMNQEIVINEVVSRLKSDIIKYVIDDWDKINEKKFSMTKNINSMDNNALLSLYLNPGYYPDKEIFYRIVKLLDNEGK